MTNLLAEFWNDESGATSIEYSLIATLIAVAIVTAVTNLGSKVSSTFSAVNASLK